MKGRLSHKYSPESLTHTKFGGRVICEDKELLYEEIPEAYKNIDQVISDLEHAGVIKFIVSYQPLLPTKEGRFMELIQISEVEGQPMQKSKMLCGSQNQQSFWAA
jgi:hypothetical protein